MEEEVFDHELQNHLMSNYIKGDRGSDDDMFCVDWNRPVGHFKRRIGISRQV